MENNIRSLALHVGKKNMDVRVPSLYRFAVSKTPMELLGLYACEVRT